MEQMQVQIRQQNWEVVTGCERLTHGCDSCPSYHDYISNDWSYHPKFHWARVDAPLENPLPTRYTVAIGSDLFHEAVTEDQIGKVFEVMNRASRHYFEILTKRAERATYISKALNLNWSNNISLGYSIEDARSKWRIDYLRETGAKIKCISMVPLLGDMGELDLSGIALVGVAHETWGLKRPCKEEWIEGVKRQCNEQGVIFTMDEIDIFHTFQGES
mgnify:CR=1 FL=1